MDEMERSGGSEIGVTIVGNSESQQLQYATVQRGWPNDNGIAQEYVPDLLCCTKTL